MALRERGARPQSREPQDDLIKKLVEVRRVAKVVKGGRTMRFSALVVVGDGAGSVGVGTGKSAEVPDAIEKATQEAKKRMVKISVLERTIPHGTTGVFGRGKVILLPGALGSGVIAGGPVRSVLEACGIKDIVTKSIGTNNKINVVKATMEGLMSLRTREEIAAARGKAPEEI
ncbi:MAG: 30S ribosomal protein S5 [Clostridiales bacterium]|jgi:small subunit ribosomal protein S5|nr:30S ribosomal protein S5 [Clostridiales bacterium]